MKCFLVTVLKSQHNTIMCSNELGLLSIIQNRIASFMVQFQLKTDMHV